MRTSVVAVGLVVAAIPCAAAMAAGMDFAYAGQASYDGQPAKMTLTINGTAVTGRLVKQGVCGESIRLTQTNLILTGVLTGAWEGSGTIIGNWTGGDWVCGAQLTQADGYPQAGTFSISMTDNTVSLMRTGGSPLPSGWTYDFGASGRKYGPSLGSGSGPAEPILPVGVELPCSEASGFPCTLLIQELDAASGALEGWIQWPGLGSKHHISGTFDGRTLSFVEDSAIVSGGAALGCLYTLEPCDVGFAGSYAECASGPPNGQFSLTVDTSGVEPGQPGSEPGPATPTLPIGVELPCGESSGQACTLLIQELDAASGALEGWIHWSGLGSKHHISGTFDGRTLSFVEDSAIVSGGAALGCCYTLEPCNDGFVGSYAGCAAGPPTGDFKLTIPAQ